MLWLGNLRSVFGQTLNHVEEGLATMTDQFSNMRKDCVAENLENELVETSPALTLEPATFWLDNKSPEALHKGPEELYEPPGLHIDLPLPQEGSQLETKRILLLDKTWMLQPAGQPMCTGANGAPMTTVPAASLGCDNTQQGSDVHNIATDFTDICANSSQQELARLTSEVSRLQCEVGHWRHIAQGHTIHGGKIPQQDQVCKLKNKIKKLKQRQNKEIDNYHCELSVLKNKYQHNLEEVTFQHQKEMKDYEGRIAQLESLLQERDSQIIVSYHTEIHKNEETIHTLQAEKEKSSKIIQEMEKTIKVLGEKLSSDQVNANLAQENLALKKHVQTLEKEKSSLNQQKDQLETTFLKVSYENEVLRSSVVKEKDLNAEVSDLRLHLEAKEKELKEIISEKEILRSKLQELDKQNEETAKHLFLTVEQVRKQQNDINKLNRELKDAEKRAQDLEKEKMNIIQEKEAIIKNTQQNLSEMRQVSEALKKTASDFKADKENAILACEVLLHQLEEAIALHKQNSQEKKNHVKALERKTAQLETELCEIRKKSAEEAKAYEETIEQLSNVCNAKTSKLQQKHDCLVKINQEKDLEIELKNKIAKMHMDDRETKTILSSSLEEKKHLTQLLTEKEAALIKLQDLNMQLSTRVERSSHDLPNTTVQNLSQNMQGRNIGIDAMKQNSQALPTVLQAATIGNTLEGITQEQFENILQQLGKVQQQVKKMEEWKRQILIRVHGIQFKSVQVQEGLRKSVQDKDVTIKALHQSNQQLSDAISKSSCTTRKERQQTEEERRQRKETEHSLQNSVHQKEVMLKIKSDQLLALNGNLAQRMNENKVLREAEANLKGRIADLEISIYEIRGENKNLLEQCKKDKVKCQELQRDNITFSTRIQEKEFECHSLNKKAFALEQQLKVKEQETTMVVNHLSTTEKTLHVIQEEKEQLLESLNQKQTDNCALQEEIQHLHNQELQLKQKIEMLCSTQKELMDIVNNTEDKVDKTLIRNLFIGHFKTPQNQRVHVLRMMGNILDIKEGELEELLSEEQDGIIKWMTGWIVTV
ncbi:thyroid receptor-interacting protein 11-like [Erinaceus europaeus]|uniref:Thyroid receptor-interacting protein 11-like n=1 Tax=Erinaceus europaeus TaxID=9365 RepID=A0ABM3XVY3_ERIEU|nr:thyroid receptor-interacting protein 11-like [Erinaceus europaeus]